MANLEQAVAGVNRLREKLAQVESSAMPRMSAFAVDAVAACFGLDLFVLATGTPRGGSSACDRKARNRPKADIAGWTGTRHEPQKAADR